MAMTDEIKRISANGTEFAYVEFGQGEPVILFTAGCKATECGPSIFLSSLDMYPHPVVEPLKAAGIRIRSRSRQKRPPNTAR
jgi:hypothetical protein